MTAVQPLLAPFAAAWLIYVGLGTLMQSRALRIYDAGLLPGSEFLRDAAQALAPDALLSAGRHSVGGMFVVLLYAALACAAVASWCWAIRIARTLEQPSMASMLLLTALLGSPLLAFTGLFSDDVYLYNFYGRIIDAYGANPVEQAPAAFLQDPHLRWVHWKELPASYGPLWLMLSAPLSAIAGDSISAVVVVYRAVALALHLAVAAAIWLVLRRTRPQEALAGTIFYAWNPLVLLEVVGNAHNDVLVALFAVLLVAAAVHRAWSSAAFFGACAVMVKPFAVLLLPALALRMAYSNSIGRTRVRRLLTAMAVGAVTVGALSFPLWAGMRLLTNIQSNPASHSYTNTLWELIAAMGPWLGVPAAALQHPYLDAVRMACFLTGTLWVLTRGWARRDIARTCFALWMLFSMTAAWVWPWYFVPAIALSVFAGRTAIAGAIGLTLGGMLFWAAWTPPPFGPLHAWRAVLLFGPLVATLVSSPVRSAVLATLGPGRAPAASDDEAIRVRLQAAPG